MSFSDVFNPWAKYHHKDNVTLHCDPTVSEFLFESYHLLLEDETHSARCYGHITKYNEKS